jgi:hypothetical protein
MANKVTGEKFKLRVDNLCRHFQTIRISHMNEKIIPIKILGKIASFSK